VTVFLLAMSDAADKVVADDERAMELLEQQLRRDRHAESMRPHVFDPDRRCDDCSEPIGIERLKLLSNTGRCAACARIAEQRLARMPFA
jgi:RNA polymerase-binding transcription factor DksA